MLIPRSAEETVRRLAGGYPVVVITGPRQSGKTTLARKVFGHKPYVSLGLANDCGVTHSTARAWLSVLEAGYIVHLLAPHHRNFNKRLVKTPKLYFLDPGLAAWLLGIQSPQQLATHAQRGALFETWVVGELLKARYNRALASNLYFWRDRTGHEVDLLIDRGDRLIPVEVKAGQAVAADCFAGLEHWRTVAGAACGDPWLVYAGEQGQSRRGIRVGPWREMGRPGGLLEAAAFPPAG